MAFRDEDALQRAVVKAVLKEWPGSWWFHPVGGPYQRPGIPDLLLCVEGTFIGIELKNPHPGESEAAARDRTTTLQRKEIRGINAAGGTARTALTVEECVRIVRAAVAREGKRAEGEQWLTTLPNGTRCSRCATPGGTASHRSLRTTRRCRKRSS